MVSQAVRPFLSHLQPDWRPPASSGLPVETRTAATANLLLTVPGRGPTPWGQTSMKYYELPFLMQRQQLKIARAIFRQHLWDLLRGASGLGRAEPPVLDLVTGASHKYTARSACELQPALSELWWAHSTLSRSAAWMGHLKERPK